MGWMWSSQSPSPSKGSSSNPHATQESNTPAPTPAKQAESDYGDPEIAKFIAQFQAELSGSSKPAERPAPEPETKTAATSTSTSTSTSSDPSSTSSSSSWGLWGSSKSTPRSPDPEPEQPRHQPSQFTTLLKPTLGSTSSSSSLPSPESIPPLDPVSESLLPTSMSCRQAFDLAYHCNSLGGQWTSVYRSGSVRPCSEHWDDFWFCMRTRTYSPPQREAAVRAHYRRKEYLKYHAPGRPSSADVWEPRAEKLPPGEAFSQPFDTPDVPDEEWRRREILRRRMVQEMLRREEEEKARS